VTEKVSKMLTFIQKEGIYMTKGDATGNPLNGSEEVKRVKLWKWMWLTSFTVKNTSWYIFSGVRAPSELYQKTKFFHSLQRERWSSS